MAINSLSASSYGLSGLLSGINTQEMVEKMLSGTQARIDKATQQKMSLQNKQTMYRDVMTKLKTLQSTYLSFTSGTNLLSDTFYNTMTASITTAANVSAAFSVTATSDAAVGNTTMDYIKQLATARTSKTTENATGAVSGEMDLDVARKMLEDYSGTGYNNTLNIKVGASAINIANAPMVFAGKNQTEIVDIINKQMAEQGVRGTASFVNNKLQITADDEETYITVAGGKNAMKMFGTGISTLSGQGSLAASVDTDSYSPSFEVNLDGRKQTIHVDLRALAAFVESGGNVDAKKTDANGVEGPSLFSDIEGKLRHAFGNGVQVAKTADGNLAFTSGAASQKFTITGTKEVMSTFGLTTGVSNKLNTNMALKELNFATELQGNKHTFSINGVSFSYDSSAALSDIISDINNSKAGVKISYIESEDRFVLQSSETGAGTNAFDIKQTEGNLMSVLFGEGGSNSVTGYGVKMDMVSDQVDNADIAQGGVFTFNINGKDVTFTLNKDQYQEPFTTATLAARMNSAFADYFGFLPDGTQSVQFLESGGKFTIRSNGDNVIKATDFHKDKNTSQLGFTTGQGTVANDGDITLAQAGIRFGADSAMTFTSGGTTVTIDKAKLDAYAASLDPAKTSADDLTMDELTAAINKQLTDNGLTDVKVAFNERDGAFNVKTTGTAPVTITMEDGAGNNLSNIFGQETVTLNAATANGLEVEDQGQNAIFSLNGYEMERASNSFTINGLSFTLNDTTYESKTLKDGATEGSTNPKDYDYKWKEAAQVNVARDTDKIVDTVVEFLKMYNETVDYLNGFYKSDATYKDYPPLTAKQKEDMSDKEIELWEEKSKEGLLRNDMYLERILSTMRKAMYSKPEGSNIAIYDLGITTSYYTNDGNLNPESIADLRTAIENDPEAVRQLFAGEGGLMEQLNNAINEAARSSYGNAGYIAAVAGSNAMDTTSSIYKQIDAIDDQLVTLEDRYWNEYNRYWNQFNRMEQMIQQMNSQSSWLSQFSGGG